MEAPLEGKLSADCLLISANRMKVPYPVYPIGIAHIMGALHSHGHRVKHIDILASDGYAVLQQCLRESRFDIVGISIRNIDNVDSTSPQGMLGDIAEVMRCVRMHSSAPVVLGGPGFSIMPDILLAHLNADYGIVGEGENALPELIAKIIQGDRPEQKLFSSSIQAYPDCRPLYSQEVAAYYVNHGGMLNVQTKRGCNYGCIYCSYPTIEGRRLRFRDPAQIVEEIKSLGDTFGARYIFFTDGVFNDPDDHYLLIAEELIRSGNTLPWCAFFRPQNLSRDAIRLLKRSGMAAMELGTDASSDTTLAALNKGFTFEEVIAVNDTIAAESIASAHFIMFGGPGENEDTARQGLANIDKLRQTIVFAYIGIRILPQTKLYEQALREKSVFKTTDLLQPLFYYSPHVKRDFLDSLLRQAFDGRRDRIYPMADMEHLVPLLHQMGHDGPLWNLLLESRLRI